MKKLQILFKIFDQKTYKILIIHYLLLEIFLVTLLPGS